MLMGNWIDAAGCPRRSTLPSQGGTDCDHWSDRDCAGPGSRIPGPESAIMSIAGVAACNDRIWRADTGAYESGDDRVILSLVWKQYANRGSSEYEVSANTRPELKERPVQ